MATPSGRAVQAAIYRAGLFGRRPRVPTSFEALESAATTGMSRRAVAYLAGSAGQERTAAANVAAFEPWRIVPRILRDVSTVDLGVDLLGSHLPAPLLFSPIGALELAHRGADVAVAQAAAALKVPMILSSQASRSIEECASAAMAISPAAPQWFQLYWSKVDDLAESFVRRAEAAGCKAIVVTLDTPLLGWRPRDLDLGYLPFAHGLGIAQYTSDPVFTDLVRRRLASSQRPAQDIAASSQGHLTPLGSSQGATAPKKERVTAAAVRAAVSMARHYPGTLRANLRSPMPRAAVETFLDVFSRPSLTWDDLAWLRERTRLPIVLKGILHADDAAQALDVGVDALIVSNHGGRQVDGEIAALEALPAVVSRVDGRVPILFDSGVRSGSHIFTALALGAAAVCVGRPWVYGLALAGRDGAEAVMANLWAELEITMTLAGCASIAQIDREKVTLAGPTCPQRTPISARSLSGGSQPSTPGARCARPSAGGC